MQQNFFGSSNLRRLASGIQQFPFRLFVDSPRSTPSAEAGRLLASRPTLFANVNTIGVITISRERTFKPLAALNAGFVQMCRLTKGCATALLKKSNLAGIKYYFSRPHCGRISENMNDGGTETQSGLLLTGTAKFAIMVGERQAVVAQHLNQNSTDIFHQGRRKTGDLAGYPKQNSSVKSVAHQGQVLAFQNTGALGWGEKCVS